jgi:flagella basal body P-ring formation protein FlgA
MKITRPGAYAESANQIAGFTSNRNIKQGEAILLRNLTSSNVVKKGRRVKIIARYGAASATADGITLEDGRPGEWVKVRRADDRNVTLRARIVNENLVEVQVD